MASYEIKNLSFTYASNNFPSLTSVSLSIPTGSFMLLVGSSGSGKSTLLRQLKQEIAPEGTLNGTILYDSIPLNTLDSIRSVTEIGMVFQDPDQQIVMSTVYEELAFGMENLGFSPQTMQRRIAEISTFFGMGSWLYQSTHTLSGGQKQLLNLASVMTLQPKVLLLDEPTSQLDPLATKNFLSNLKQLNDELGITIIMSEHRLENLLPLATHVTLLKSGQLMGTYTPKEMIATIHAEHELTLSAYIPAISQLYLHLHPSPCVKQIPLTPKSLKTWLDTTSFNYLPYVLTPPACTDFLLSCKHLYFQYEKHKPFVLEDVSLDIPKASFTAILGGNGSGKSTFLKVLAGILPVLKGKIKKQASLGYLPQNPRLFFNQPSVRLQLEDMMQRHPKCSTQTLEKWLDFFDITSRLDQHPYDLSGGEMQKVALILILISQPHILLLDEPTKGLDPTFKEQLALLFKGLINEGMTLVMVSHDMEFVAKHTDFATLMFSGKLLPLESTPNFFEGNTLYTTPINRAIKSHLPNAITFEDVICHVEP